MASRLELHEELCGLLGKRNVYYQPPENVKIIYPCIIYSESAPSVLRADNRIYKGTKCYQLIAIDRDPDSDIAERTMNHFEMCSMDRPYTSDGLCHWPLTLYY